MLALAAEDHSRHHCSGLLSITLALVTEDHVLPHPEHHCSTQLLRIMLALIAENLARPMADNCLV